jgi:hypothetical protein
MRPQSYRRCVSYDIPLDGSFCCSSQCYLSCEEAESREQFRIVLHSRLGCFQGNSTRLLGKVCVHSHSLADLLNIRPSGLAPLALFILIELMEVLLGYCVGA